MTGGARGLGRSIARRFSRCGGRVVLCDLDASALERTCQELGAEGAGRPAAVVVDVTSDASVDRVFESLAATVGRVDVLVNGAGVIARGASESVDSATTASVLDVNVVGVLRCCRAAFPLLRGSADGCVVNFASVGAIFGMPGRAAYNASKSAVVGLTRTLAAEWGPHGLRVNAIAPGFVDTPMMRSGLDSGALDEQRLLARIPLRRLGDAEDIGGVAAFLASPDARYITGAVITVDGGLTIDGTFG